MTEATRDKVLAFIRTGVRCFDGAMGTMLMKSDLTAGACPETAEPEIIKTIHRTYVGAGAQFVTTNTFGGTRVKLKNFGLEDRVEEINSRNARLAREAAPQKEYFVAGDIGPTGEFIEPFGSMTFDQFRDAFSEQAKGLLHGGVDLVIIETMMSLDELLAAVEAVNALTDLPLIACMTFNRTAQGFRTMTGVEVKKAVAELQTAGVDIVGSNCTLAPADMADLVKEFDQETHLPIIAQPNAKAELIEGETVYSIGEDVEGRIRAIIENGASIVGGCCGTTPEYIATMRAIVDSYNS